jgi:hypothetical protein
MANNFRYSGKRIILKNISAPVAAGNLCRQKGWLGIPLTHALTGASISFAVEGVWGLTFSAYAGVGAGPLPVAGSILYWDVANAVLSNGCGVNDYPVVKLTTDVSSIDGSFEGLLCTGWDRPKTADQS